MSDVRVPITEVLSRKEVGMGFNSRSTRHRQYLADQVHLAFLRHRPYKPLTIRLTTSQSACTCLQMGASGLRKASKRALMLVTINSNVVRSRERDVCSPIGGCQQVGCIKNLLNDFFKCLSNASASFSARLAGLAEKNVGRARD